MSEHQWTPRIRRIDNDERERFQYIGSLIREKRSEEARDELLAVLQQNDKSTRAHLMLGSLYQEQGLLAEALDHFKHAMTIDPMDAQAYLRAGTCSLRMNELDQAKSLLKAALDLDPKLIGGRVAYAQTLSRLGEPEAAIAEVEQALRLDPQMASARLLLAQLLNRSGRAKEAIAELDDFVSSNPANARAAAGLAQLQGQQGDAKKAIEVLEAAARATPDDGDIWSRLGRMKMATKDYSGAETAFKGADPAGQIRSGSCPAEGHPAARPSGQPGASILRGYLCRPEAVWRGGAVLSGGAAAQRERLETAGRGRRRVDPGHRQAGDCLPAADRAGKAAR